MLPISRWDVGLEHVHLKAPIVLRTQCITSAVSIFGVALFLLGHATAALEFSTYGPSSTRYSACYLYLASPAQHKTQSFLQLLESLLSRAFVSCHFPLLSISLRLQLTGLTRFGCVSFTSINRYINNF